MKIFFLLAFLSLSNFYIKAQASVISYIDLDYVMQNSNFGKNIFKKIEDEKKIKLNNLKKKESEIKNKEIDLYARKNIISNQEFEKELVEFQEQIKNFDIYRKKTLDEYEQIKNNEILNFFKVIDPYIQEYLRKNSIDILFNNKSIIIGKDNLDITEKIIKIIDKEIK